MKIIKNKKGISSVLAITILVVLAGSMGTGLWLFSRAEIVNFGNSVGVNITGEAINVTVSELSQRPEDWLDKKVVVTGAVGNREDNACVITEKGIDFPLACWAPLDAPPPVNTNVQLAETRTMDYYYNKRWQLTGLVKNEGGKYFLSVEAYNLVK